MDSDHRGMLDQLKAKSGKDFDQSYDQIQLKAHQDAVALFEAYAKGGDDAALKTWAAKTLPHLKQHLRGFLSFLQWQPDCETCGVPQRAPVQQSASPLDFSWIRLQANRQKMPAPFLAIAANLSLLEPRAPLPLVHCRGQY
jgi:Domain of unknown function (DUF4142)